MSESKKVQGPCDGYLYGEICPGPCEYCDQRKSKLSKLSMLMRSAQFQQEQQNYDVCVCGEVIPVGEHWCMECYALDSAS